MHDIIAISNKVGHPDIFLTMTCNPYWPEITENLFEIQRPEDRPELCSRVFRVKMKSMVAYVIDKKLFGTVSAHARVIEFQKRGLPHAHIIFFLDIHSKQRLKNPLNIDKIISADIPSSEYPELRAIILRQNIHNPCGANIDLNGVCMVQGQCSKRYPK